MIPREIKIRQLLSNRDHLPAPSNIKHVDVRVGDFQDDNSDRDSFGEFGCRWMGRDTRSFSRNLPLSPPAMLYPVVLICAEKRTVILDKSNVKFTRLDVSVVAK